MQFDILTLFPESFDSYFDSSIIGRARKQGLITTNSWDIRDHTTDKHKTVDDTPYGGGPGMVMKIEPIDKALTVVKAAFDKAPAEKEIKRKVILFSAKGKQFTQQLAQEYAMLDQLIMICGRYEGIDQRVADYLCDEEISVGPYVLAGGELPAMVVTEAVARHIPGVLGNPESLMEESHTEPDQTEYPQYTKPEEYRGWPVPKVLLSGNHGEIEKWRKKSGKSLASGT